MTQRLVIYGLKDRCGSSVFGGVAAVLALGFGALNVRSLGRMAGRELRRFLMAAAVVVGGTVPAAGFEPLEQVLLRRIADGLAAAGFRVADPADQYEVEEAAGRFLASRYWPRELHFERRPDLLLTLLDRANAELRSEVRAKVIIPRGFGDSASHARLSPDGRFAGVYGPGGLAVYETESGLEIFSTRDASERFEFIRGKDEVVHSTYAKLAIINLARGSQVDAIDLLPWNLTNTHAIAVDPADSAGRIAIFDGWMNSPQRVAVIDRAGAPSMRVLESFPPLLAQGGLAKARLVFSDDGRKLALATLVRVIVWDVDSGRRIVDFTPPTNTQNMVEPEVGFSGDGQQAIALVGSDRRLALELDLSGAAPPRVSVRDFSGLMRDRTGRVIAVSRDDAERAAALPRHVARLARLMAGTWPLAVTQDGKRVMLWRLDRGTAFVLGAPAYSILAAHYDQKSGSIVVADRDGLRSIAIASGKATRTRRLADLRGPLRKFSSVMQMEGGRLLIVETEDVTVIDAERWSIAATFKAPMPIFLGSKAWHEPSLGALRVVERNFTKNEFALKEFDLGNGETRAAWHREIDDVPCLGVMCGWNAAHPRYVAISNRAGEVLLLAASTGEVVHTFKPEVKIEDLHPRRRDRIDPEQFRQNGYVVRPLFEAGGEQLTVVAQDPRGRGVLRFYTYELQSGRLRTSLSRPDYLASRIGGADRVAQASNGSVSLFDQASGSTVQVYEPHPNAGAWVFQDTARDLMVSIDASGVAHISELASGRLLATVVLSNDDAWLAVTPAGFFDGTRELAGRIGLRLPSLQVLRVRQLERALGRHDLVAASLAGDPQGLAGSEAARLDLPRLNVANSAPTVIVRAGAVDRRGRSTVMATIVSQGFGVGRVEWRRNGALVALDDFGGRDQQEFRLQREIDLDPGPNRIEVAATDGSHTVRSQPAVAEALGLLQEHQARRLHVLAIGISDYQDRQLKLSYAASDAKAVAESLRARGRGLFESVHAVVIDGSNASVTAGAIDAAFRSLAARLRPQDTTVVFVAGHGKTLDGRFYFLPQDFRFLTSATIGATIARDGIPQSRWEEWFTLLNTNTLIIFDACETGSLVDASARALAAVSQTSGRAILTAASSSERALEGYRERGLLTFALLEALERADTSGDRIVDVSEVGRYVSARVPALARERGYLQVPQMELERNFPIARAGRMAEGSAAVRTPEPTHVVTVAAALHVSADPSAPISRSLLAGALVQVVVEASGLALVAQEGEEIGYVGMDALARLH